VHDVLVDAGPLIAVLDRDDAYHARCVDAVGRIRGPLVTAWPVVTEAMYLLADTPGGQDALWSLLQSGAVVLRDIGKLDVPRMRELMQKYRDLPMDLADAALVRLAERDGLRDVLTVDGDFGVYRLHGSQRFRVVSLRA
jgi:hypothetical protein